MNRAFKGRSMNRTVKLAAAALAIVAAASIGFLSGRRGSPAPAPTTKQAQKVQYSCPMHPFILKDQPSSCPVCGMELVKKVAGEQIGDQGLQHVRHVALSPTQQVLANVKTVEVSLQSFARDIVCTGVASFNQERQGKVSAWAAGRIERLLVKSVGAQVKKGLPVAEIFSLDLYNAEQQYLMAYKTIKILNSSLSVTFPINTQMSLGDAHDRLRQLGFRQEQFEALQKSGKPNVRIPFYSPFSGVVTEKFVQEGQYVNIGEPICSVAELSTIWVDLEVFESDLSAVRTGQEVVLYARSYPGVPFHGKVKLIYPFLDPKTRTVRLRVELPNPGGQLKPEMYVTATIKVPMLSSLLVPAGAVMDTGKRQVVWVESQPGVYLQRVVTTGARSDKGVQILSGLKVGEKVAVSGGYLIDSEAQLSHGEEVPAGPAGTVPAAAPSPAVRPAGAAAPAQSSGAASPARPGAPAVAPGKKDAMDMGDMNMK
jgi:membrane fusion protein, copper/silver efflux system